METFEETGPVDIVVIAFPPGARMSGESAPLLMDLVERGIIRVLDLLFVRKDADGSVAGVQGKDLDEHDLGSMTAFEASSPGMLRSEDLTEAAEALEPGAGAIVIVYENRWVVPFASAVRRNGGVLVARERVAPDELQRARSGA